MSGVGSRRVLSGEKEDDDHGDKEEDDDDATDLLVVDSVSDAIDEPSLHHLPDLFQHRELQTSMCKILYIVDLK